MGLGSGSREQRRQERFERRLPLVLLDDDGSTPLDSNPVLRDISAGGMSFETGSFLNPGSEFRFCVELPGRGLVRGKARSRWIHPGPSGFEYLCGAQFQNLASGDTRALKRFLRPGGSAADKIFDALLGFGCCILAYLILRDSPGQARELYSRLMSLFERAPAVVAAAAGGLILWLLKR